MKIEEIEEKQRKLNKDLSDKQIKNYQVENVQNKQFGFNS